MAANEMTYSELMETEKWRNWNWRAVTWASRKKNRRRTAWKAPPAALPVNERRRLISGTLCKRAKQAILINSETLPIAAEPSGKGTQKFSSSRSVSSLPVRNEKFQIILCGSILKLN